jgi:GGDEF domain-containing protein
MNELRRGLSGEWIKQALPTAAVLDAVLRISQLKRHVDLLAHYDAFDYAMLLPNTRANGAHTFATRIIRALTSEPLGGIDPAQLSIAFGSATIPDDFVDLSSLLGAADLAMVQARQKKIPLVMFRDIKHCVS